MPRLAYPVKGKPITEEWGRTLVDTINELLLGPEVASPLVRQGGAIALGQDFQIWNAKTTGTISARSGTTWGSGTAAFYTVNAAGVESAMLGYGTFKAWNYFGASIASGIRIQVCWTYEKWVILGGDCSGVA